jgi:hypothetical protein
VPALARVHALLPAPAEIFVDQLHGLGHLLQQRAHCTELSGMVVVDADWHQGELVE